MASQRAWLDVMGGTFRAEGQRVYWSAAPTTEFSISLPVRVPVAGDEESAVPQDTIDTLLDLARADRREDFMALAGMVGVSDAQRDELWTGTRRRLGKEPTC